MGLLMCPNNELKFGCNFTQGQSWKQNLSHENNYLKRIIESTIQFVIWFAFIKLLLVSLEIQSFTMDFRISLFVFIFITIQWNILLIRIFEV